MKRKRFAVLSAATIISLALWLVGCGSVAVQNTETGEKTIRIAYLPLTHALPVMELSTENGVKVELVKYGSWPELLDALNTGKVDGASVLIELAMKAKEQTINLKAAALGHKSGNVVVVSNSIATGADLKGKTFAIPHRSSSHNILMQEVLEKNGLTTSDIKVTELAPAEMPYALVSGQIAGFCVAEPFGSVAVSSGYGKVLYQSDELWEDSICCALVFNQAFLQADGALADQVIEAYHKAGHAVSQNNEALLVAKRFLKQSEAVLTQSLQWIDYTDLQITEKAYEDLTRRMVKYGISENPPSYEAFVYRKE